jgi:hypothetical protein
VKLFFAAYFFGLGWLVRKTGTDVKLAAKIGTGIDRLAARAGEEFGAAFQEILAGEAEFHALINPDDPLPDEDLTTPEHLLHDTGHGK